MRQYQLHKAKVVSSKMICTRFLWGHILSEIWQFCTISLFIESICAKILEKNSPKQIVVAYFGQ